MNSEKIYTVLVSPHVSEKSAMNAQNNNQYVFKVQITATKVEIKTAVEALFEVKVTNVQTSIAKGKVKRSGKSVGKRKDWKKAYITLAEGSTIDMMSAE
ncbi:MAG: 50S ribosomal protein L23 [Pseudomonadota bacterium]